MICTIRSYLLPFLFIAAFCVASCKKDQEIRPDPVPENKPASVIFQFDAQANNKPLAAGGFYTNNSGDIFSVSKFNYYISNVKLIRPDSTRLEIPESYYLLRHLEGINSFTLTGIPSGSYIGADFTIGVDSLRNVSGAQTGALDPGLNMFWDWNSGYIFFKLEGMYNTLVNPQGGEYAIHIGGFSGKNSCLQHCSLAFPSSLAPVSEGTSKIYIKTVVDEIFVNPAELDFETYYASVGEKMFKTISVNYRDMFTVTKVQN